ncbi:MAG: patatin-like phospholipase family protein [Sneathiella sp.]
MPDKFLDEKIVLVLQGGGALGAYQAGAFAALHDAGYEPAWMAGISIGSINAALIAGNPPEKRVDKLREFWHQVSSGLQGPPLLFGEHGRRVFNEMSAVGVAAFGIEGFFTPRMPASLLNPFPSDVADTLSLYDTAPLRSTLLELVDFDRLNNDGVRFSVGAVNVRSGNFVYFDSEKITIKPEHIMASGALPEGFPPVEIDGEWYWDGGLVSNTPLQYVIDEQDDRDLCIFQVDLFSAEGEFPKNLFDVTDRLNDIRYSSRTRLNTDVFRQTQAIRRLVNRHMSKIPEDFLSEEEYEALEKWSCDASVTVAHLIYRQKNYEAHSKGYEFSRQSVHDHWQAGEDDVNFLLGQKDWINRVKPEDGVKIFDFKRDRKKKGV